MAKSITLATNLAELSGHYSLYPFAERLSPLIDESLKHYKKWDRAGTKLVSPLVVWLVLALTIRRDLNTHAVLDWMISGWRWLGCMLPKQLVADGTISHARMRLGKAVFERLFNRMVATIKPLPTDFHGFVSMAFDGSSGRMPDSKANRDRFGKANSRRKGSPMAYPRLRWMSLLAIGPRLVLDVAHGPFVGKGTGEHTLMMQILTRLSPTNWLFLADAGLYSFIMMWTINEHECAFVTKASKHYNLPVLKRLGDGSYLCERSGTVVHTEGNDSTQETLTVRVIPYQIPGFRPARLVTNLLDTTITANALALHYHQRWDIELYLDELKTHQCATLRGQMPTLFRSKRPELVEQELYALLLVYNLIRELMWQAATQNDKDPRFLSFLDCLQLIIDAVPHMSQPMTSHRLAQQLRYLLELIAQTEIDRPRRPRVNERVVKVKMSKFKRKTSQHRTRIRNIEKELTILPPEAA